MLRRTHLETAEDEPWGQPTVGMFKKEETCKRRLGGLGVSDVTRRGGNFGKES